MDNHRALKDFLVKELSLFISEFQNIKVSVSIDDSDVVFVEVLPNSVYHLDQKYIDWEFSFMNIFMDTFPHMNISFITDDAIIKIANWDFQMTGNVYNVPSFCTFSIASPQTSVTTNHNKNNFLSTVFTVTNNREELNTFISNKFFEVDSAKQVFNGTVNQATKLVKNSSEYLFAA